MKVLEALIVVLAWGCAFFAPRGDVSRALQFLVFGTLGLLMCVFGAFSFWWDSSMRPTQKSAFTLVCGILSLVSQAGIIVRAMLEESGIEEWRRMQQRSRTRRK